MTKNFINPKQLKLWKMIIKHLKLKYMNKISKDTQGNGVLPCVSYWVSFDFMKLETRPKKYGKYLICRKDGKIHLETWNGSGWAYNHNEIRYWAEIIPPCS